jgi:Tol biopolymer transport system component
MVWLLVACSQEAPQFTLKTSKTVTLMVDGDSMIISTKAGNVRELLGEASIEPNSDDIIDPPSYTPLSEGLLVTIIRVTESFEFIQQSIPYQRRTVRNESMSADDPPLIIQGGRSGLQESAIRIVYYDGLEHSRQETNVTIVEAAQDEIVMVGVGSAPGNIDFTGLLAYISGGNSLILRGSSAFPEQINSGGSLDHRVFSLSPTGNHLLYTKLSNKGDHFNTLWIVGTASGSVPLDLDVYDVLWADWNPDSIGRQQIAYTTANPTDLLPGWEANNDLWLIDLPLDNIDSFLSRLIIESYPATYGWWGGNYAWSPTGGYIAYSFADEIGLIDIDTEPGSNQQRRQLQSFTEFNTQAEWVWVPSLTWSYDGRFLAYTRHDGDDPDGTNFDIWIINPSDGYSARFVPRTGIWSHPLWSPMNNSVQMASTSSSRIAHTRAINPLESLQSGYTLWLMDQDGSNAQQIFPPAGENSRFSHEQHFMAWSPDVLDIAFVYDKSLYIYNVAAGEAVRITRDDNEVSNPTWAPYGRGNVLDPPETIDFQATPIPVPGNDNLPFE